MGITKDGRSDYWKKAIASADFMQLSGTDKYLSRFRDYQAFIGHNRASTRGKTVDKNSHPFKCGNITMVHNGTLTNVFDLPKGLSFDVDSEALASAIDELGIDEAIIKTQGAFAIVYHNALDNTINIVRNIKRPINFCKVKNQDTILLSSEIDMLKWIAGRTNHKIEFPILIPNPGDLITFDLNSKDVSKYSLRKLELYTTPVYTNNTRYNDYSGYGNNYKRIDEPKPPNKDREARQKNKIEALGFDKGEQIFFTGYSYEPYNKWTQKGKIVGCMCEAPYLTVMCHDVRAKDFESGGEYVGDIGSVYEIKNAQGITTEENIIIIPDSLVLIETYEEQQKKEKEKDKSISTDTTITKEETKKDIKLLSLFLKGPGNSVIDRTTWAEFTKYGCSQCSADLDIHDAEDISWPDSRSPMCPDCTMKWNDFSEGKTSDLPF